MNNDIRIISFNPLITCIFRYKIAGTGHIFSARCFPTVEYQAGELDNPPDHPCMNYGT